MPAKNWRFIGLLLCMVLGSFNAWAQQPDSIAPGKPVPVRIITGVSSEDFFPVKAIIDQPVLDSAGQELIRTGTEVTLMVSKTKARGSGRPGQVIIEPLRVPTVNGQMALLQGSATFVGEDLHDKVVLATVGGCLFFGLPGLLLLLIEGKPAYIQPGFLMDNIILTRVEPVYLPEPASGAD